MIYYPGMDDATNNNAPAENAAASGGSTKSVIIFSTPVCHFCQAAKEFFTQNNVEYTEHDVSSDQDKRSEMIEMTGQMGVPVIVIGEDVVVGFDEAKVKELLEL